MAIKAATKQGKDRLPNALVELPEGFGEPDGDEPESNEPELPPRGFQVVSSAKEHRMPEFPAKRIEANKAHLFFEWVDKLEESDFDHLAFYIYRNWPVIDRKKNNPNAGLNIGKLTGKVGCSLEYICSEYGSGDYKILINDINKTVNGKGGTIGHAFLAIRDANRPPILIYDELVTDDPQNRSYVDGLKAKGIISNEGKLMTPQAGGNNEALIGLLREVITNNQRQAQQLPSKDGSTEAIAAMYRSTHEATMGMLKDQIKTDGPDKTLGLISAIKEMLPRPESNNGLLEIFMKMQLDATARADAANARVMEILSKKPEDAEAKVLEKMALYKELFGGGDGHHQQKRSTAEIVVDAIAPIGAKVFDIIASVMSMKNYQAGLARHPAQPVGYQEQQPQPQAQQLAEGEISEMPRQTQPVNEFEGMLGAYGGFILEAVKRGDTGDMFAQAVETMAGPLVYQKIAATGAEALLDGMKSVPMFWQGVQTIGATEQVMSQFCTSFVEYGNQPEEEEGKE